MTGREIKHRVDGRIFGMSRFRGGRMWWWGARADSSWRMSMYRVSGRGVVGRVVVARPHGFVNVGWSHKRKEGREGGREKGKIEGRRNAVPFTTLSR